MDQKTGEIRGEKGCSVVDLPGIYSLRPYTQEEIVSRDYILNQKPDGIINIVDATNIERNLYLTLQLLELRVPMVLALNMMDEVRANGGTVDVQRMSRELGIPVCPFPPPRARACRSWWIRPWPRPGAGYCPRSRTSALTTPPSTAVSTRWST